MSEIDNFYEDSEPNESESERSEDEDSKDVKFNENGMKTGTEGDSGNLEQEMEEDEGDDGSNSDEMAVPSFLLNRDLFNVSSIPEESVLPDMSPAVQKKMEHKTNKSTHYHSGFIHSVCKSQRKGCVSSLPISS